MAEIARKIALLGMGTVGSGVYNIIEKQKAEMPFKVGAELEITKVLVSDARNQRNLTIKITDKNLIDKTGGIVQGMSGSPIIQNGMLVGAVTHVFLDDCTEGYGILAEDMIETAEKIAKTEIKKAS